MIRSANLRSTSGSSPAITQFSDRHTVTLPTVTLPTVTLPAVILSTLALPTMILSTLALPTVTLPIYRLLIYSRTCFNPLRGSLLRFDRSFS